MDVAVYNQRVMGKAHVENSSIWPYAPRWATRVWPISPFPADVQDMEGDERSKRNKPHHTSDARGARRDCARRARFAPGRRHPERGKKIVIMAGQGALGATDQLEQLAERLGAPIVKPLLGKGTVPDDSPFTTGGVGLLGTRPSQEALEKCDTLLMVGTSFPYIEYMPKPDQARGIQIDIDPLRIGLRYPVEVGLVGDSARTLDLLPAAALIRTTAASWSRPRRACRIGGNRWTSAARCATCR